MDQGEGNSPVIRLARSARVKSHFSSISRAGLAWSMPELGRKRRGVRSPFSALDELGRPSLLILRFPLTRGSRVIKLLLREVIALVKSDATRLWCRG